MKNLGLKLLSVSIAFILYMFVHSQTNSSVIALVVPVELKNLPKEKMVLLPSLRQAQVTIKGPSFLVREVAISSPAFHIDLPEGIGDRFEARLTAEDLPLPPAVEVVSIEPPSMDLVLDSVVEREVGVEVPRIGRLADSVRLVTMEIQPPRVKVRGPATEANAIASIETEPLDMREIGNNVSRKLKLRSAGRYTKTLRDSVSVEVQVASVSLERVFEKRPVEVRIINGYSYEISPSAIDVEVTGPKKLVARLDPSEIVPYVRVDEAALQANELDIQLELPNSLSLVALSPPRVKIVLKQVGDPSP